MRIGRMRHSAEIWLTRTLTNEVHESTEEKVLFVTMPCSLEPIAVVDSPSSNSADQVQQYKITTRWSESFTSFIVNPERWSFRINGIWYTLDRPENWQGLDRFIDFYVTRSLR